MAGAACSVNHAVNLALLPRDHRHDEAIFPNRDEIFPQRAVFAVRAQKAFERFLNVPLLPFDIAAEMRESDAGIVGNRSAGQNLSAKLAQQRSQIRQSRGLRAKPRITSMRGGENRANLARVFENLRQFENLERLQNRAFDAHNPRGVRDVWQRIETHANRRAARSWL